jgi:hypothetical protein
MPLEERHAALVLDVPNLRAAIVPCGGDGGTREAELIGAGDGLPNVRE